MGNTELEGLYARYVDYMTCLRKDMDRVVGKPVSPKYQARLLSLEDFSKLWQRWGDSEGEQDLWRRRFELGYEETAADFRARFVAAVSGTNAPQTSGRVAA